MGNTTPRMLSVQLPGYWKINSQDITKYRSQDFQIRNSQDSIIKIKNTTPTGRYNSLDVEKYNTQDVEYTTPRILKNTTPRILQNTGPMISKYSTPKIILLKLKIQLPGYGLIDTTPWMLRYITPRMLNIIQLPGYWKTQLPEFQKHKSQDAN